MIHDSTNPDLAALSLFGEAQDDIESVESSGIKTYRLSEAPTVSFGTITEQAQTQVHMFSRTIDAALILCCAVCFGCCKSIYGKNKKKQSTKNKAQLGPGSHQDGPGGTDAIVAGGLQMTCARFASSNSLRFIQESSPVSGNNNVNLPPVGAAVTAQAQAMPRNDVPAIPRMYSNDSQQESPHPPQHRGNSNTGDGEIELMRMSGYSKYVSNKHTN